MGQRLVTLLLAALAAFASLQVQAQTATRIVKTMDRAAAATHVDKSGSYFVLRCRTESDWGWFGGCANPTPGDASKTDYGIGVYSDFDGIVQKYVLRFIDSGTTHNQTWTLQPPDDSFCPDGYESYYLFLGTYCTYGGIYHIELYPHTGGPWTVQVLADGVLVFSEPLTVHPGVLVKSSGDLQSGIAGEDARFPLVVTMTDFDGVSVTYPIRSDEPDYYYVDYTVTAPGGANGQAVSPSSDSFFSSSQVSFHFGSKAGTYTINATHSDTDPLSPPFQLSAVLRKEPDDNEEDEEGNGEDECAVADPVTIGIGNSFQQETDYPRTGLSILEFTRSYNALGSKSKLMRNYWTTTFDRAVLPPLVAGGPIRVRRPDGQVIPFSASGGVYAPARPYFHETLRANGTGWQYVTEDNITETYDAQGRWTTIVDGGGRSLTAAYNSSSNLTKVTANTGESLTFGYNTYNQISSMIDHTGRAWTYSYSGYANLKQVKEPDGLYHTYFYQSAYSPYWLTGIAITRYAAPSPNNRHVSWEFDANGRVTANYYTNGLRRFDIGYNDALGERSVVDALNHQTVFKTRALNGRGFVDGIVGPGFASCGLADAEIERDASMNVIKKTTLGRATRFGNYDAKGQYGFMIEADGKPSARRTDYVYDPRFLNKPTSISRPSVASGHSQVTQLTYDAAGNVTQLAINGFRPDGTAVSRGTTYQYAGPYGQLSQMDGPRTDVADITRFDYDPTTKRLLRVTDANGIVLRNNIKYTTTGQVISEDRPNGLRLTYTYETGTDLLKSLAETGGGSTRTTTWTYDDRRRVASLTFSDGVNTSLATSFAYNVAGDLTQVSSGNSVINYTVDNAGNRVRDSYSESGYGAPEKRWIQRTFDAYGRVFELINPFNRTTYNVHPDGTLTSVLDGRNDATTHTYDDFLRITQTVQPTQVTSSFAYDSQDRLTRITDGNQASTNQSYDDLGNLLRLESPDIGVTTFQHDAAGNVSRMTDALGQVTIYAYDAGNRIKTVDRIGAADDESYVYDSCLNGAGKRCDASNGIGDFVRYEYDAVGRVTKQTTNAGTVGYKYNAGGQVMEIAYPSQRKVRYRYNTAGQVTAISVVDGGNPYPLATNVSYLPFGPVTSWTYGNGLVETRQYDLQYRPTSFNSGGRSIVSYGSYDGNNHPTQRTINGDAQSLSYDSLSRLDTASGNFGTRDYDLDAVSNRTQLIANGQATTYTHLPQSNRLTSDSNWTYERDANGNETRRQAADGHGFEFTYTADNRLLGASSLLDPQNTVGGYRYNALGQRTVKSTPFADTRFVYGLDGALLAETLVDGSVVQEYVYLEGQPIALLGVPASPSQPFNVDQIVDNPTGLSGCRNIKTSLAVGGSYARCDTTFSTAFEWPWLPPVTGTYEVFVMWLWDSSTERCFGLLPQARCVGPYYYDIPAPPAGSWVGLGEAKFTSGTTALWAQSREIGSDAYRAELDAARFVLLYPDRAERDYKYVHADILGTPMRVTDRAGVVVWQANYDPFGSATVNDDPDADGVHQALNLRFPGQYYDAETGLHHNGHREYDSSSGRYLQSDPIGLVGGFNTYAYVKGNPLSSADPLGLSSLIFSRPAGMLYVYNNYGLLVGQYPAGNNTTQSSRGAWEDGTYDFGYWVPHSGDGPNSAFGSNGNNVFNVPGCVGCGVHAGRQNSTDRRGGSGVKYVTEGCIRTTDQATALIQELTKAGDPLTTLTVTDAPIFYTRPFDSALEPIPLRGIFP